jgi:CubicO group peptidase (beta-lactamase class C family)
MTDITLNMTIRLSQGQNGAFLDVKVIEVRAATIGNRTYDIGQTDADGVIHAVLRPRRKIRPSSSGPEVEDPFDRPSLQAVISDAFGHSFTTNVQPFVINQVVSLPENFHAPSDEAPTDPAPTAGSPSALADQAIRSLVERSAPGYVFVVRKNGAVWANATRGLARVGVPGVVFAQAMTNDTIIQLASMSKPITAAALVAMIDDWTSIRDAVAAIGRKGAPTTRLRLTIAQPPEPPTLRYVAVPAVLAPLFANRRTAAQFLTTAAHLLDALPAEVRGEVRSGLHQVAQGAGVSPLPVVPPGHLGLLRHVLAGVAVPDYADPFLPLIRARLGADAMIAAGVEKTTIKQLLIHNTVLVDAEGNDRSLDPALHTQDEINRAQPSQPPGGPARFDYWLFMKLLLSEPYYHTYRRHYSNHNYTLLTMVIEACTETTFDDYVTRRLFFDRRFSHIRRHVVEPNLGPLYYDGTAPGWIGGILFSDYTAWPGNGGLYASANQLTDWMLALYARQTVAGVGDDAPLVSITGHQNLFGNNAYFSGGIPTRNDGPVAATIRFQHNGGAGRTGGGFVGGNLAIVVPPGGAVYTALFVANGNLNADTPFTAAINALPWG